MVVVTPGYVEGHVLGDLLGDVVPARPAGARQPGAPRGARRGHHHGALRRRPGHLVRRRCRPGARGSRPTSSPSPRRSRSPSTTATRARSCPASPTAAGCTCRRRPRPTAAAATRRSASRSSSSPPVRRTPSGRGWCATAAATPTRCSRRSPGAGASAAGPSRPTRPAPPTSRPPTPTSGRVDLLEKAVADAPFELPGAGEDAAWRRWRVVPRRRPAVVPRRAQPARPRRHLPALALPPPRGAAPALAAGRHRHPVDVRQRDRVARVLRRRAVARAGLGLGRPQARAEGDDVRRARGRHRGVAHRHDGLPDRRRRDAAAAALAAGCTTGCG